MPVNPRTIAADVARAVIGPDHRKVRRRSGARSRSTNLRPVTSRIRNRSRAKRRGRIKIRPAIIVTSSAIWRPVIGAGRKGYSHRAMVIAAVSTGRSRSGLPGKRACVPGTIEFVAEPLGSLRNGYHFRRRGDADVPASPIASNVISVIAPIQGPHRGLSCLAGCSPPIAQLRPNQNRPVSRACSIIAAVTSGDGAGDGAGASHDGGDSRGDDASHDDDASALRWSACRIHPAPQRRCRD